MLTHKVTGMQVWVETGGDNAAPSCCWKITDFGSDRKQVAKRKRKKCFSDLKAL